MTRRPPPNDNKPSDEKAQNYLRPEDRILWELVAKTTKPLAGKKITIKEEADFSALLAEEQEKLKPKTVVSVSRAPESKKEPPAPQHMPIHDFDRPTHRKISKGRLDIEARIDLHGMTQNEAYELLYGFLINAHARGLRHVMVITGKGRSFGSQGILRQAVPHWFSTPLFRLLVSAYEDAARHHGGDGALYVRLRRKTQNTGLLR